MRQDIYQIYIYRQGYLHVRMNSNFQERQNLSRNISTPTLRSGKLPPVHFFPTGSPFTLHDTYNDLLRKATAKSRSSVHLSLVIQDGNYSPIKVPRGIQNKSKSANFDRLHFLSYLYLMQSFSYTQYICNLQCLIYLIGQIRYFLYLRQRSKGKFLFPIFDFFQIGGFLMVKIFGKYQ